MITKDNTNKINHLILQIILKFNEIRKSNHVELNIYSQGLLLERNIGITSNELSGIIRIDEHIVVIESDITKLTLDQLVHLIRVFVEYGSKIRNGLLKSLYSSNGTDPVYRSTLEFGQLIKRMITETRFQNYFESEELKVQINTLGKSIDKAVDRNTNGVEVAVAKLNEDLLRIEDRQEEVTKVSMGVSLSYEKNLKKIDELFKENLAIKEKVINDYVKNVKKIEGEIVNSFNDKSDEVDRLIGTISDKALSGSYSKYAEEEKSEADQMRRLSFWFMLFSIALALTSFFESIIHEISDSTIISRVVLAIVLSIPAAYFARESAKHRVQQQHYRKIDLDLKAVGPYSLSLPDNDRHELKKDIASKIFAKNTTVNKEKSYPVDIQELILEVVKSAKNEVKGQSERKKSDTEKTS